MVVEDPYLFNSWKSGELNHETGHYQRNDH
jgi:hypothetical protein